MHVLMVSWEFPPELVGGLGRHVHALADAMARAGHRVTVLTRHTGPAAGSAAGPVVGAYDLVAAGVRVVRVAGYRALPSSGHELLAWTAALNSALTRAGLALADADPPDVVHAHDWLVADAGTALERAAGVPLVATVHATEAGRHQGWLPDPLNRAIHAAEWSLAQGARRVVTCSAAMRWEVTRLFQLPPDKVDLVPNGVDPDRWRTDPAQVDAARRRWGGAGPLVVYSGRLVYEKGVHDLLAALPLLRRRHPGIRLVVAGTGPKATELRELRRRLRLGRSVDFPGFVPDADLAALVAAADCSVVPSVYEPFGLVALEAAAAGTPVAVSDVGGLREIVEHRRSGLRFSAGDPDSLADAVSELISDPALARRLVRQARAVLSRDHTWAGVAGRTVEVYARARREEGAAGMEPATVAPPTVSQLALEGNLLAGSP